MQGKCKRATIKYFFYIIKIWFHSKKIQLIQFSDQHIKNMYWGLRRESLTAENCFFFVCLSSFWAEIHWDVVHKFFRLTPLTRTSKNKILFWTKKSRIIMSSTDTDNTLWNNSIISLTNASTGLDSHSYESILFCTKVECVGINWKKNAFCHHY